MTPRTAFIALLVLNLLVFGWTRWIDTAPRLPAVAGAAVTPPSAPATGPAAPAAADAAPVLPDVSAVADRCVSVGPFRDTAESATAIEAFRKAGYEPRSRAQTVQIEDGFWVHVDSLKSAAEQRRTLAAIKRAGIDDASAMPESEPRFRVSVGIFSDRDRAERRAQRVRALDIDARVDTHSRATTFYWLDMAQRQGEESLRLDVLNGQGPAPGGLTLTACPATVTPG